MITLFCVALICTGLVHGGSTRCQRTNALVKPAEDYNNGMVGSRKTMVTTFGTYAQHANGKTSYVRYGSFKCPNVDGTSLVYTGYAAGTQYSNSGGGIGPICMPDPAILPVQDPAKIMAGFQNLGRLYGSEYETSSITPLNHVHNRDVPCTVCLVSGRTTEITIPGRTSCPSGWTLEYKGYLMSGHFGHQSPTKFICMDEEPDVIVGSGADVNGQLFYTVEIAPDSHLCAAFGCNGQEVACVVCSI